MNKNPRLGTYSAELFPNLDVEQIVTTMNAKGYADGVEAPGDVVAQIINFCDSNRRLRYFNPHKDCEPIDRLARDPKIVEIARRYLGAEPILLFSELRWYFGNSAEQQMLPSPHQEPLHYNNSFHYDTLDFKSLSIIVYLSDVFPESGPHMVIEGTHEKTFVEICNPHLSDVSAQQKFGDRIKTILGPKGTMLFEETSAIHKAAPCKTKRLSLKIDYVLHRTRPPFLDP